MHDPSLAHSAPMPPRLPLRSTPDPNDLVYDTESEVPRSDDESDFTVSSQDAHILDSVLSDPSNQTQGQNPFAGAPPGPQSWSSGRSDRVHVHPDATRNLPLKSATPRRRLVTRRVQETQEPSEGLPQHDSSYTPRSPRMTAFVRHVLPALLILSVYQICVQIMNTQQITLSSFCSIPWAPNLPFDLCKASNPEPQFDPSSSYPDFPRLLEITEEAFRHGLLDGAENSEGIALEMAIWEMTAQDLATLVQYTTLKRKGPLVSLLQSISDRGNTLAYKLPEFGTRIWGTFKGISQLSEWALQNLEETEQKMPSRWNPIGLLPGRSRSELEQALDEQFRDVIQASATYMEELHLDAMEIHDHHNKMREDIRLLGQMIQKELRASQKEEAAFKRDPLKAIWMLFGGGELELDQFRERFKVLGDIEVYKDNSSAFVAASIEALATFRAQIREVRRNVAAPGLVGSRIPLSLQMKSIRESVAWGTRRIEEAEARRSGDISAAKKVFADRRLGEARKRLNAA